MGAPPLWNFQNPLLLDVTLHRKLTFTFLLCSSCPFLDRRPHIGKNISLRAFRQVLLKNEVHFQLHNYDLFENLVGIMHLFVSPLTTNVLSPLMLVCCPRNLWTSPFHCFFELLWGTLRIVGDSFPTAKRFLISSTTKISLSKFVSAPHQKCFLLPIN